MCLSLKGGMNISKSDCVVLLEKTEETQLKEKLLGPISLITDLLGQELIKKAASPNTPIDVQDLRPQNGSRDEAILRLFELEKLCLFTSAFDVRKGRTTRIFTITDTGRKTILS